MFGLKDVIRNPECFIACDHCIILNATTTILLDNGAEFYSCDEHVSNVIETEASTENPVHSIEKIEEV